MVNFNSSLDLTNSYEQLDKINQACLRLNQTGEKKIIRIKNTGDQIAIKKGGINKLSEFTDYTNNLIKKCNENLNANYDLKNLVGIRKYCTKLIKQNQIEIESYHSGFKGFLYFFAPWLFNSSIKKLEIVNSKLQELKANSEELQKNILVQRKINPVTADEIDEKQMIFFNEVIKTRIFEIGSSNVNEESVGSLKTRDISNRESGENIKAIKKLKIDELRQKIQQGYIVDNDDILNAYAMTFRLTGPNPDIFSNKTLESILSMFDEKLNTVLDAIEDKNITDSKEAFVLLSKLFEEGLEFYKEKEKTSNDPGTPNNITEKEALVINQKFQELKEILISRFEQFL